MATSFILTYKEEIEALGEFSDYEERGDAIYLHHEDDEARLEWAFYRPSGSHPEQVADKNHLVAIMAFNHSRLTPLKRFSIVNPEVIADDFLRNKIRNRSRMLFRAMVDDDFKELVSVLKMYPMFFDLAYDQMINGRIWNEIYANPLYASQFLTLAESKLDDKLIVGLQRRLQPISGFSIDEAKDYLKKLHMQVQELHRIIKVHYADEFQVWLNSKTFHPLQKITWQKHINILQEPS